MTIGDALAAVATVLAVPLTILALALLSKWSKD